MRKLNHLLILSLAFLITGCALRQQTDKYVYQYSTSEILNRNNRTAGITRRELRRRGKFGYGMLSGDSTVIVFNQDNEFRIDSDGTVTDPVYDSKFTYARVSKFNPDKTFDTIQPRNQSEFIRHFERTLSPQDAFYGLRITGRFDSITVTSRLFNDSVERTRRDITGQLIGFRLPPLTQNTTQPRYRFVFVNRSSDWGGVVRHFNFNEGEIAVDRIYNYRLSLPQN
ncbi:MAG: acetolactate decarboxylase [bacterium]